MRKTQRLKLFCLVWQFFAWVDRKMVSRFFSRLSFCVFHFPILSPHSPSVLFSPLVLSPQLVSFRSLFSVLLYSFSFLFFENDLLSFLLQELLLIFCNNMIHRAVWKNKG
ncbi:hypothetical protein AAZX31_19G076100 [Glycine max]